MVRKPEPPSGIQTREPLNARSWRYRQRRSSTVVVLTHNTEQLIGAKKQYSNLLYLSHKLLNYNDIKVKELSEESWLINNMTNVKNSTTFTAFTQHIFLWFIWLKAMNWFQCCQWLNKQSQNSNLASFWLKKQRRRQQNGHDTCLSIVHNPFPSCFWTVTLFHSRRFLLKVPYRNDKLFDLEYYKCNKILVTKLYNNNAWGYLLFVFEQTYLPTSTYCFTIFFLLLSYFKMSQV